MNNQEIEIRLWNYIDDDLSIGERKDIEELLQHNETWKTIYSELQQMHQLINTDLELEQPSKRFTKTVMEEISKAKIAPAAKKYINKKIIAGIAAFFILLIAGLLLYGFAQVDWTISGNTIATIDLKKFDLSQYLDSRFLNIFIMLNAVLGLILFDKVLRRNRTL
jgi:hypothetical protein